MRRGENNMATSSDTIARLQQLETDATRLRKLIDGMREVLFELDADARLTFLNPAWTTLTGFSLEASLHQRLDDFLLPDNEALDFTPARLAQPPSPPREVALRTASGAPLWANLSLEPQRDARGCFSGAIGTLSDVTKNVELNRLLTRYQEELYQLSISDPLTGLFNRRHFDTQLEAILADHLRQERPVCLLLIDLDGFKFINDTYGHPFGDEALRTTAALLREQVRRNDYVARVGGDEFGMVLKNTNLENAAHIARKLNASIHATRLALPVGAIQLQASIGVAEAPTHGRRARDLVSAADVALYQSKRHGRNRIGVLSQDASQAMMSIFSQGFQLRNALQQGRILPALQPIYDVRDGKPVAYEVLARMQIDGALIPAVDFIAVAEELGLTRDVDLHIIAHALARTPAHQALFLNVDLSSFSDPDFVRDLRALLAPACAEGRAVTIEFTEREAMPLSDSLHDDIQALRALGCKLALDDFGSGYSTYGMLNQLRPDYLKIEGAFVRGMLDNASDHKIVTHIHELAQSFGAQTIAECVENAATEDALRAIGIRNAQGNYYGAPALCS
jgi:diguanylate cyclase (GGDEF)-like protein/PAS domain S-box-containing protein